MPDDLIALEDHSGAPVAPPPELAETPPPVAAAPVETPPAPPVVADAEIPDDINPDAETDPRVAGLLRDLIKTRKENKQLRPAAQAAAEISERLRNRPDVLAMLNGQPAPAAAPPPAPVVPDGPSDQELTEIAQSLALYNTEGKPDLDAARRIDARTRRTVDLAVKRAIETEVAPLRTSITNDKASQTVSQAMGVAETVGAQLPQNVQAGWRPFAQEKLNNLAQTNPAMLADPQMAATSLATIMGLYLMQAAYAPQNGRVAPPAAPVAAVTPAVTPPTFTELSGNRPIAAPVMSDMEQTAARRLGIKPADWQKAINPVTSAKHGLYVLEDE